MYLRFISADIEGFQSLSRCQLSLDNQGFVAIKGINQFDAKARSNGSGKSSLLESVNWCLFGKTSAGVTTVKNRYYPDGCKVCVELVIDGVSYTITRSQDHKTDGTNLKVVKNGSEDISCRNRSDTDKLLKAEILPFSQDIFLSTIFLSQGFSGRLSILTPSARKERLEILCNIDAAINDLKTKLTDKKNTINSEYIETSKKVSFLNGQLQTYTTDKSQIEILLKTASSEDTTVPEDRDVYEEKLRDITGRIGEISEKIGIFTIKINELTSQKRNLENQRSSATSQMEEVTTKLSTLRIASECPLCHQEIKDEKLSAELEKSLTDQFDAL
jgi:DNA repair exonuclease SbcCD ATPase subunit